MTAGPCLLNPMFVAGMSPDSKLQLLARAGIEVHAGVSPGWSATVGDCMVTGRDFPNVVETAIAMLALQRDLWPRPRLVDVTDRPETATDRAAWDALAHNGAYPGGSLR